VGNVETWFYVETLCKNHLGKKYRRCFPIQEVAHTISYKNLWSPWDADRTRKTFYHKGIAKCKMPKAIAKKIGRCVITVKKLFEKSF
jgi:hypothetical protein